MTARGQGGVTLIHSPLPATSPTDELRHYPKDPLATPLDQRSARLHTEPGDGRSPAASRTEALPGAGPLSTVVGKVSTTFDAWWASASSPSPQAPGSVALPGARRLARSPSRPRQNPHGRLPGGGAPRHPRAMRSPSESPSPSPTRQECSRSDSPCRSRPRWPGETVLTWLGLISGLMVTGIGLWLLRTALTKGAAASRAHGHTHGHSHTHGPHHLHDHVPHQAVPPVRLPQQSPGLNPTDRTRAARSSPRPGRHSHT